MAGPCEDIGICSASNSWTNKPMHENQTVKICGWPDNRHTLTCNSREYLRSVKQMPKRLSRVRLKSNWFGYISVHVRHVAMRMTVFISFRYYIFGLRLKCSASSVENDSNTSRFTYLVARWFVICIEWKDSLPAVAPHYTRADFRIIRWLLSSSGETNTGE